MSHIENILDHARALYAALQTECNRAKAERDKLRGTVEILTRERDDARAALRGGVSNLINERDGLRAELSEANSSIENLVRERDKALKTLSAMTTFACHINRALGIQS